MKMERRLPSATWLQGCKSKFRAVQQGIMEVKVPVGGDDLVATSVQEGLEPFKEVHIDALDKGGSHLPGPIART